MTIELFCIPKHLLIMCSMLISLAISIPAAANPEPLFAHPPEVRKEISTKCHELVGGVQQREVRRLFWESCLSLEICKAAIGQDKCERRAGILKSARRAGQIDAEREKTCLAAQNFEKCLNRKAGPAYRPYLGLSLRSQTRTEQIALMDSGLIDGPQYHKDHPIIKSVTAGSPAHNADLQVGDTILGINDKNYQRPRMFWVHFRKYFSAGETVTLKIARAGEVITKEITLGAAKAPKRRVQRRPAIGSGGWRFMQ